MKRIKIINKKYLKRIFLKIISKIILNLEKILIIFLKINSTRIVFQREDRIGHQVGNFESEVYKTFKLKEKNINTIFIFYELKENVSNLYVREVSLKFLRENKIKYLFIENNFISKFFSIYVYFLLDDNFYFKTKALDDDNLPNNLFEDFVKDQILEQIGIKKNKYICIYSRDSKYLEDRFKNIDFSYHNYRNSDINNLKELSLYVRSKYELSVIRVGSNTSKKISWEKKEAPLIFDYSRSELRNDENDVNLISQCFIYINNQGGPFSIANASRRKILTINHAPFFASPQSKLWLPKLIRKKSNNNYLTINDIVKLDIHLTVENYSELLQKYDLFLEENSSSDLLDLIKDYFKLMEDNFSPEDKLLINGYRKFLIDKGLDKLPTKPLLGNIAPSFLRKYPLLIAD